SRLALERLEFVLEGERGRRALAQGLEPGPKLAARAGARGIERGECEHEGGRARRAREGKRTPPPRGDAGGELGGNECPREVQHRAARQCGAIGGEEGPDHVSDRGQGATRRVRDQGTV